MCAAFAYLNRCAEQEEGQVEEGEAGQQVLLLRHGAPVFFVLTVHHHHVDHEAHHGQAENQAEEERVLPPGHAKTNCVCLLETCNLDCQVILKPLQFLKLISMCVLFHFQPKI